MPGFIKTGRDEELWEKAKGIVEKEYGKTETDGDEYWRLVTAVYKKAGGSIGKGMVFDVKELNIVNLEKSTSKKPLPEGGVWRTIKGHKIYIKDGEIFAGHIPGVTDTPEFKKLIPKGKKKSETKLMVSPAKSKKSGTEETQEARKKIDEIANSRPKEPPKKSVKEAMAESKKATDEALKKPNPKSKPGKSATKEDLDKLAEEDRKNKKQVPKAATPEEVKAMFRKESKKEPQAIEITIAAPKSDKYIKSRPVAIPSKAKKEKKVADIRSEKQTNRQVAYDVGEKVGGARKDLAMDNFKAQATGQSLEELEKIAPELAQKMCIKANILQSVDFEKEYKTGTAIEVAMVKKLIYDRIAPKPAENSPEGRKLYLNAIRNLQRELEPIKTWDEFKEARKMLGHWMRYETEKSQNEQKTYLGYAEKKLEEGPKDYELTDWHYDRANGKRVDTAITKEQWNEKQRQRIQEIKKNIKEAAEFAKSPYAPLGEKLINFFTDSDSANRTIDTINKKNPKWEDYFNKDEKSSEGDKPKLNMNKVMWERIMPAKIKREGGRATKVVKPEDMVNTFNFRGVEFGNWVDDTSGKFHLVKCAEAYQDLADILGIDDKDVSLHGRLAMAFGARGQGAAGKVVARAHYEPSAKVINITKEGGAGALAHEWGHALDNIMYQQSAGKSALNYASEGMEDVGSPEVKAAYDKVMEAIMVGSGEGTEEIPNKHNTYYRYHPSFKQAVETLGLEKAIQVGAEKIKSQYAKYDYDFYKRYGYSDTDIEKRKEKDKRNMKKAINEMSQEMAYHHENLTGTKIDNIKIPNGKSKYFEDSSHAGGSIAYYTSKCEMFARAFENYIEGKMKSGKVKNDYLTHGTWINGENEGIRFMGQLFPDIKVPYPCGKERDMIHAAFDGLIGAIRKAGAIKKGLSFDMMKSAQPVEGRLSYFGQVFIDNYKPEDVRRCAYRVDWISFDEDIESVFYIPINRLKTDYQTSEALNFDKIRENVEKMKEGVALEPIVIGYDYDVHDGHHRIEASKIMNFTHVPCVVRGNNDIEVQRAKEAYAEVWKSFNEVEHPRDSVGRFTDKDGQDKDPKITEVYHFTRDKDFKYDPNYKNTKQEMGAGLYTAPLDDAMYWHRALQDKNGSRHKYAIPIDVSEAKLVHTDDIPYDLHELAKHLIKHYGSPKEALKHVDEEEEGISGEIFGNDPSLIAQRRLYAKTKGYDGIIMHDDREGIQVILFNSDHVKFKPAITADDLFEEKKRKDFPFLNMKSLNIVNADSLQKSITRAEAKNLHKDLPPGGVWRTMHGHHIYIKDGKVLAGAVPGVTKTRKATKAELKEHQAAVDKEAVQKNKKPVYNKDVEPKKADNKKKGAELYVRANKGEPSETGKAGRKTAKDQRADNRTDDKGRVQQRGSGGTGQSVLVEYKKAKPKEFHSAIAAAKANNDHGAFVDLHDEEDYKKDKLLLSPGGGSGCAIESNGNIVSAFKDPKSNEQGAMHHILINALKNGGDRLDCYDGFLPKAYAQHGFIPVARLKFNREYASPDWNYERDGEPDVVFMAHNGDSIDTIQDKVGSYPMPDMSKVPYVDDYDAGVKMRNDYIDGIKNTSEGVQKKEKPLYINNEKEQSSQNKNKEVSGMKEEFSVFNSSSAKNKYLKVKGSSVELNDGVKAFVYKKKDGGYSVCELVSGSTLVSAAKTPEAAIDFANNLIKTKGSRIKSEIVNHIQNYGMAPSTGTGAEENLTKLSRQEINERFRQLDTKLESESKAKYDPQLEELKKQEKATRLKLDEAYKMRRSKKRDALTEELDKNIEDILRKQNQVFREKMEYQQQGKDNSDIGKEYRRRNEIGNREIDGSLLPEEEKELDKELGAKPFNANASDEYFYRHNSDGWDSRAVSAKPIDLGHGIEGFVVSNKNYSELNVYEAKTGLRLTTDYPYDSSVSNEERLRRAANRAKLKIRDIPKGDALNEGSSIDNFKNKIADIVKQNGMSPRYNEDGTAKSSKQAVAKPTVPKEEKPFYIYKRLEDGSKGFAAVEGKKVKIADGLDTFTHKIGSRYTITEARSGLAFATDMPTREAAISKAKEIIDSYGIEKIKTMMEDAVGRQGLSPRYKD